jgi:hypothetical protein
MAVSGDVLLFDSVLNIVTQVGSLTAAEAIKYVPARYSVVGWAQGNIPGGQKAVVQPGNASDGGFTLVSQTVTVFGGGLP